MKLLILSDCHKEMNGMLKAVEREQPDAILHLGDHYADAQELKLYFPDIPLYAVEGNTDYAPGAPVELLLPFEGKLIYMTHGHLFGVKLGLSGIIRKGRSVGADLVLFGHTHRPLLHNEGQMLIMNPGTIGHSLRSFSPVLATYGVVSVADGDMACDIKEV